MTTQDLKQAIHKLKQQKDAIILGHYYAPAEVQDIADFLGDSLALSHEAAKAEASTILFAGVHFMAETAAILCPSKRILTPTEYAGCSLAEGITAEGLRAWHEKNPTGLVISYVNTTAAVKAETDYCCTSSNALKIVASLPEDIPILFGPDRNLGAYISQKLGRELELWDAACFVHERIDEASILRAAETYPEADILIHPESSGASAKSVLSHPRCFMYSTSGILQHIKESPKQTFIVATEPGVLYQAHKLAPKKTLIALQPQNRCHYMQQGGLWEIYEALRDDKYVVTVPEEIRSRALLSIQRMMSVK